MTNQKNINSRIIHKHDIEANWQLAVNFIPKAGELIIYDIDASHYCQRIKIGDGVTTVINLPFLIKEELITVDDIDTICGASIEISK